MKNQVEIAGELFETTVRHLGAKGDEPEHDDYKTVFVQAYELRSKLIGVESKDEIREIVKDADKNSAFMALWYDATTVVGTLTGFRYLQTYLAGDYKVTMNFQLIRTLSKYLPS